MTNSKKSQKSNQNIGNDLPAGIGQPAIRALTAAEITNLKQFTKISKDELMKLHGIGPKAIRLISEALEKHGLNFANLDQSYRISENANKKIVRRS